MDLLLRGPDHGSRDHADTGGGGGRERFTQIGKHGVKSVPDDVILCNVLIYEAKNVERLHTIGTT